MKKVIITLLVTAVILVGAFFGYMSFMFKKMSYVADADKISSFKDSKAALMVVDVQEGSTGEVSGAFDNEFKAQSAQLINTINIAIDWAEKSKIPVIYIKQESTNWLINILTKNSLAKGKPGSEIDKRIKIVSPNLFGKQLMNAFSNPELDTFLITNKINILYITGVDAAYCVDRTIKGALNRSYKIYVVKDAIATSEKDKLDALIKAYKAQGVIVISSSDLPATQSQGVTPHQQVYLNSNFFSQCSFPN